MRANALLKHNIHSLLRARGQTRRDLAQWCRRSDAWLSQIFKEDRRELPLKYLDRVADFFGVATYQLLQPGISRLTERRGGLERRTGRERRIGRILDGAEPPPPPTQPQPAEWALISKFRKLTAAERERLDHAADVLLLSRGVEATTARHGNQPGRGDAGAGRPRRVRRLAMDPTGAGGAPPPKQTDAAPKK